MQSFSSWHKNYLDFLRKKVDIQIQSIESSIQKYKDRMVKDKNPTTVELDERRIRQFSNDIGKHEKDKKKLGDESSRSILSRLNKHSKVEEIQIRDNKLNIFTGNIYCPSENNKGIGKFRIVIPSSGLSYLNLYNLDYEVGEEEDETKDHWAVNEGNPCLGDWYDDFHNYYSSGNLFLFFDTIMHYLSISKDEEAFMPREDWFDQREKLSEKKKKLKRIKNDYYAYQESERESEENEELISTPSRLTFTRNVRAGIVADRSVTYQITTSTDGTTQWSAITPNTTNPEQE